MNNHPSHSVDLLEWESLFDESIELLPNQIDRAVQYSQQIPTVKRQWPVYLQMLAFSGFIQWLEEWSPELNVSHTHCSILKPEYANLLEAVCNLQVGSFSLCLVAVGNLADTVVNLPKAIVDLPQFTPHIYVLLVVQEEEMLVQVCGYLRHDQLLQQQQLAPLSAASNWNYHVPLNWFNSDSNALLLDLNCLDPAAISLPASPFQTTLPDSFQLKLTTLLPKLQSPAYSLEQDLTWQEWATLLTSPDLAEWLYQTQLSEANEQQKIEQQNTSLSRSLSVAQLFSQQTVNAGLWLRDQLDAVAQELSWVLMPPFNASTAPAMRSVVEELETVASTLRNQGFAIPQEARGAYRD
ncbi:MAG: DUF1822 family protein, partial [Leptolyngbyaceae cyanobacterium SM1_4_3]|nr:DUF1822 family protein [Leptolyngbyaceae cyanobacterium SM1_4_3]